MSKIAREFPLKRGSAYSVAIGTVVSYKTYVDSVARVVTREFHVVSIHNPGLVFREMNEASC